MADSLPVPSSIWKRFVEFLRDGRTGQVTFDIHRGTIREATIQEKIRASDDTVDRASVQDSR